MNYNNGFLPITGRYPMANFGNFATRGNTIFDVMGRIGSSIKKFNWSKLFNGMSKTLNFVNQTIPLVKQAKPVFDNVRNIAFITKSLRSENNHVVRNKSSRYQKEIKTMNTDKNIDNNVNNNPIFFI